MAEGRRLENLLGCKWTSFIHSQEVGGTLKGGASPSPAANLSFMKLVSSAQTASIDGCCSTIVWSEFHGSVYEFFRNDVLDAENFFAIKKDELRLNQFGAPSAARLSRTRLFSFSTTRDYGCVMGQTQIATVPSDAQRTGNFGTQGTVTNINPTAAALLPLIPRANVGTNEFVSSPVQLLRATSKDAGTGRWGTCSRKLIPRRGSRKA